MLIKADSSLASIINSSSGHFNFKRIGKTKRSPYKDVYVVSVGCIGCHRKLKVLEGVLLSKMLFVCKNSDNMNFSKHRKNIQ